MNPLPNLRTRTSSKITSISTITLYGKLTCNAPYGLFCYHYQHCYFLELRATLEKINCTDTLAIKFYPHRLYNLHAIR